MHLARGLGWWQEGQVGLEVPGQAEQVRTRGCPVAVLGGRSKNSGRLPPLQKESFIAWAVFMRLEVAPVMRLCILHSL